MTDVAWDRSVTATLNGIGDVRSIGWANFTFFVRGTLPDGTTRVARCRTGGWVVDKLDAGLLLGQEFNLPHGLDVLNSEGRVNIKACGDITVPAIIYSKVPPRNYVVKAAQNTVIQPWSMAIIPTTIKYQPKNEISSCSDPDERIYFLL